MNIFEIFVLSRDILIASGCANEVTLKELERLDRLAWEIVVKPIRQMMEELS